MKSLSNAKTYTGSQPTMPKLKAFSTHTTSTEEPSTDNSKSGKKTPLLPEVHKEAAFAAIGEIKTELQKHNISEDELWAFLKHRYNVESQKELDTSQWATLAAELQAAKREHELLKYLVRDTHRFIEGAKNEHSET